MSDELKIEPEDIYFHPVTGNSTERLMVEAIMSKLGLDWVNDFKLRDRLIVAASEPLNRERLAKKADLTAARAEIERLRAVLRKWLITPEYDFPGDAPELCGFSCLECKSEAATENAIEHKPECVLAAARQEG